MRFLAFAVDFFEFIYIHYLHLFNISPKYIALNGFQKQIQNFISAERESERVT
jgi:hypothetical protein